MYRLGEPLRRAIENDSIYHILVMRGLWATLSLGPVRVVGLHPGVDFVRHGKQAEADVVVLFENGDLVPVEVKKRSTALRDHDRAQLHRLASWFGSPAVIAATGDTDAELPVDFGAFASDDHEVPVRRLMTAQDWLPVVPRVSFGTGHPGPPPVPDPEGKSSTTRADLVAQHDARFRKALSDASGLDAPADPVARHLDAAQAQLP